MIELLCSAYVHLKSRAGIRMFADAVVTDDAMWCVPAGPGRGGAKPVSVLSRRFPVEVHDVALERLPESTGYLDDLTGTSLGQTVVPELTEMHPTATGGVGAIDDSPPLFAMPHPHRANRPHTTTVALNSST
jgi:hypothetical protein